MATDIMANNTGPLHCLHAAPLCSVAAPAAFNVYTPFYIYVLE